MADPLDEYESLLGENKQNGKTVSETRKEDKERNRDKDRDRKERRRSRSRDRDRDKKRDREGDHRHDKRKSRSRSRDRRSRDERYRDERHKDERYKDERYKDRRDDRDRKEDRRDDRGRDRFRDRGPRQPPKRRDPTPPEVRAARERERELKELERATRTVFAFNLNIKADERDIFEFFSKAGEVTDIRLITDRHTKRSKGLAYVEFSKQEEVFVALTLTGQIMLGQPVMVKPAEAEKNIAWEAQQAAKQSTAAEAELAALGLGTMPVGTGVPAVAAGPLRLQVTGFKKGLGENEIRQIFEPFGAIDSVEVVRDGAGVPVSIAYVVFRSAQDGQNAMAHWHGKMLLEHQLNVTVAASRPEPTTANDVGGLDDDDFKLNTQTRAALMSRLATSAGITGPASGGAPAATVAVNPLLANPLLAAAAPGAVPNILPGGLLAPTAVPTMPGMPGVVPGMMPAAVPGSMDLSLQQGRLGPPSPIPTQCLLLKNMFDASQQTEPNWVEEITEDVRDECSKYGQVLHVFVDRDSQGFVYLKFGTPEAAQGACKVLHGRFYNGHMIQAAYQFVQTYNQHFGL